MSGFPFSAVVGMAELRLGLVLNAVSPGIGGVLVRGEKGTAKSTMVRGLAAILPDVAVVADVTHDPPFTRPIHSIVDELGRCERMIVVPPRPEPEMPRRISDCPLVVAGVKSKSTVVEKSPVIEWRPFWSERTI